MQGFRCKIFIICSYESRFYKACLCLPCYDYGVHNFNIVKKMMKSFQILPRKDLRYCVSNDINKFAKWLRNSWKSAWKFYQNEIIVPVGVSCAWQSITSTVWTTPLVDFLIHKIFSIHQGYWETAAGPRFLLIFSSHRCSIIIWVLSANLQEQWTLGLKRK